MAHCFAFGIFRSLSEFVNHALIHRQKESCVCFFALFHSLTYCKSHRVSESSHCTHYFLSCTSSLLPHQAAMASNLSNCVDFLMGSSSSSFFVFQSNPFTTSGTPLHACSCWQGFSLPSQPQSMLSTFSSPFSDSSCSRFQ